MPAPSAGRPQNTTPCATDEDNIPFLAIADSPSQGRETHARLRAFHATDRDKLSNCWGNGLGLRPAMDEASENNSTSTLPMKTNHRLSHAFTRVELLAVLVAVAGLGLLALPALGASAARSRVAQCFNNLRQVGAGFHAWAMTHGEQFPWQVRKVDGGLGNLDGQSPASLNPYVHFAIASNELVTPRVLVCPSDYPKRVASDFGVSGDGFLNTNLKNNAVSYFIGLDATLDRPATMLSGDRNIRTSRAMTCGATGIAASNLYDQDPGVNFTNAVHGLYGQMGLTDGSVQSGNGALLRKLLLNSRDGYDPAAIGVPAPNNHVLIPGLPATVPE